MKQLCKTCPEQKYCTEACLESLAAEHEPRAERMKTKYVKKPTHLTGYGMVNPGHQWSNKDG